MLFDFKKFSIEGMNAVKTNFEMLLSQTMHFFFFCYYTDLKVLLQLHFEGKRHPAFSNKRKF